MRGRVESRNEFGDILQVVRPNGMPTAEQERLAAEDRRRARHTVARNATSVEECRMFFDMLELWPGQGNEASEEATRA